MKTSEAAYKVAEYIAEHGHCKGQEWDPEGRACAVAAMARVLPPRGEDYLAIYRELRAAMHAHLGIDYIPTWNDAPERSAEDVILAFKEVGAKLEAEGQ